MLRIDSVTKSYGAYRAVDELSLTIESGSIVGLLGPNGAGKTTLLRMVAGLLPSSAGSIRLFGDNAPGSDPARRQLGYMPQRLALYWGITVRENLRFFGKLYGMADADLEERCNELLSMVDLSNRAESLVRDLSGGMVRRLMLATVLVHRPKLAILDEPTAGVDPVLRLRFWEWIERLVADGTSIIISTHHISEAARAHRCLFLREGKVLADDSPRALMDAHRVSDLEAAFVAVTRGDIP